MSAIVLLSFLQKSLELFLRFLLAKLLTCGSCCCITTLVHRWLRRGTVCHSCKWRLFLFNSPQRYEGNAAFHRAE